MISQLILGIDPGPVTSGVVLYDPVQRKAIASWKDYSTISLMDSVRNRRIWADGNEWSLINVHLAMETIVSYGARIGMETILNVEIIGRLKEAWHPLDHGTTYLSRPDILGHLTGRRNAKEGDAKDRIMELHGGLNAIGKKKTPGPLYGVCSHAWSALAVAVCAADGVK